jgi:hypothetical protein
LAAVDPFRPGRIHHIYAAAGMASRARALRFSVERIAGLHQAPAARFIG